MSKAKLVILTAIKLVAAIRTVLIAVAVQSSRDAAVVLALELVNAAGDVPSADLWRLVSPVRAIAVTVAHPRLVYTSHAVLAFELR